jgi:hypothetical protein
MKERHSTAPLISIEDNSVSSEAIGESPSSLVGLCGSAYNEGHIRVEVEALDTH